MATLCGGKLETASPQGGVLSDKLLSHSLTLDQLDLGALPPWLKLAYRSFTGGQACGHSFSHHTRCDEARNTSLYPKILDNLHNHSLRENKGRHALKSWVSPSPLDQGGDPACERSSSKPPLLRQLAFGEGMVTELELPASSHMLTSWDAEGHLVMLVDSFNQESLKGTELGKERTCKDKPSRTI